MHLPTASEFFITGIEGNRLTEREEKFLKTQRLAGIILFKRNIDDVEQLIALNEAIINSSEHPPLLSVDQEGGRVARLFGLMTDVPSMSALAKACEQQPKNVYRVAAMMARELVALGFNLDFAPVCDIMSHPNNQVIGDRAFSDNEKAVAQFAKLFIEGMQGAGLAACAKHFPGHGATEVDSHHALPILTTDLSTLERREFVPFNAAIAADVATIMTAHIVTKSLDDVPATLSKTILNDMLREQLQFNNVIISDDIDMKAVADHYSLRHIIEKAILASVDLFIVGNDFPKTLAAIEILDELILSDENIRSRVIVAKKRIDKLRLRYQGKPKAPNIDEARAILRSKPHLDLMAACL